MLWRLASYNLCALQFGKRWLADDDLILLTGRMLAPYRVGVSTPLSPLAGQAGSPTCDHIFTCNTYYHMTYTERIIQMNGLPKQVARFGRLGSNSMMPDAT